MLYRRLTTAGVRLMFDTKVQRIEEGAVIVSSGGAEKRLAPVGQVIVAVGVRPRQELKELLVRKNIRHFVVGDAQEARRIIEATTEGAQAAWQI
jgi:NADH dehydrogenase FAD-containing subunit